MYMFWVKIGLFLVIVFALASLLNFSLRKIFKIEKEKKKLFSYNYVNKPHLKIDLFLRGTAMLVLFVILYLMMFKEYPLTLFLIAWILLTIIEYAVRVFFEWKYSDNPKQSILTIGEMTILVAAAIVIIQFDLLNLAY